MIPNLSRRSKKAWTFLFASAISLIQSFAATYTVTSTGDAGAGTLRQAIIDANSANVGGSIVFNIPGGGLQTIQVLNPYPRITVSNLTIDGYSQPGAVQGPIASRVLTVQITCNYTSNGAVINIGSGTTAPLDNLVIRGLLMNSQSTAGNVGYVGLSGTVPIAYQNITNIWVWGCNFGVASDGITANGISSCLQFLPGVYPTVGQASSNYNWTFGTNRDGVNDANEGNQFGTTTGTWAAIRCVGIDSLVIAGNYFNLTKNGNAVLTGATVAGYGIFLDNCVAARIGTDATGNSLQRNIMVTRTYAIDIAHNQDSVSFNGVLTRDGHHEIAGNFIGTDVTGLIPLGTHAYGVLLAGATGNTVGGTSAAQANVIAGTSTAAIAMETQGAGAQASNNNILAYNKIGIGANGSTALSNTGNGITVRGANNTISHNTITNSNGRGIFVVTAGSFDVTNNRISQNSIYSNSGSGIDLGNNGVTVNDGVIASVNTAPNFLVDYPVMTTCELLGNELTLEGYVGNDSIGNAAFSNMTLEFFIANNTPADQNGAISSNNSTVVAHGEGMTYLGSLTTDAGGLFSGSLDVTGQGVVSNSTIITTTATAAAGSTSEFGPNLLVVDNPLSVTFLKALSAEASGCNNIVSWTSGVENNLDRYELQSSSDAKYYATVATILARGSGTAYNNKQPGSSGKVYYRLRIIDVNGRISYSSIASVINGCNGARQLNVWPNPVSDMVYVSGSKEELSVLKIFNAVGQQITCPQQITYAEPVSTAVVDLDLLPGGVYYIKTATGSSRIVKR